MKDIIISVDSTSHKVNFPDEFLGIGYENLQGNLIFKFDNNFIGGQARLDISIDGESGMIPNLTPYENGYILPIKSSLLTGSNVLMQLVIDETSLAQYSLTTDTEINPNKTYYEKVGNDYIVVENPVVGDLSQYYEANTPVFKTDIFQLKVKDSINAQETIPEQYPTWINTLNTLIGTINQKLGLVDTALTEMNNLNINVSDKIDGEVTITFTDKQGNQKEVKINDGRGIVSILKTSTSGNIDTYTITYTDDTTSTFEVTNGIDGTDGRGIASIEKTGTTGLIDTYTITYTDNTTSTFNVANGKGITNIEKISTNLLVDTYRISFNDGTTQNYEVTNGKGIVSIEKTSTEGLTDIYTITYNDETTATFNVVNGKGIVSIEKTSTSGYVDTYTITYNDGTTSTYEVTNGEVSQAQLDALQDELNYYKTIVNALPKITGTGTYITLNNTANSIMFNVLNPSELSQETTTGKNLLNIITTSTSIADVPLSVENGVIKLNGTTTQASASVYFNSFQTNSDNAVFWAEITGYTDKDSSNASVILQQSDDNSTWTTFKDIVLKSTSTHQYSVTLDSSKYYRLRLFTSNNTFTNATIKVMLEYGNTKTSWEPYTYGASPNPQYPQTIHTISGNNKIVVEGSNLCKLVHNNMITDNNGATVSSTYPSVIVYTKNVNNLYISGNFSLLSNSLIRGGGYNEYPTLNSIGTRFNVNTNGAVNVANYDYVLLNFTYTGSISESKEQEIEQSFMISYANLPYTFYVSQEANINLGDIEYCEIGDYKDEFVRDNEGNWGIRKNIGKVVFTGSSSDLWGVNSVWDSEHPTILHIFNNNLLSLWKIGQTGFKSNYFICTTQTERDMDEEMITCHTTTATPYIFIKYSRLTGVSSSSTVAEKVNAFNSWLSTHNVSLYYILETPTYTKITGTLATQLEYIYNQMLAYKGQTNISQINNDLPFIIDSTALKDLTSL